MNDNDKKKKEERRKIQNPTSCRKKTAIACVRCWKSKTRCSISRPCSRCTRLGHDDCVDRPMSSRKRQNKSKTNKKDSTKTQIKKRTKKIKQTNKLKRQRERQREREQVNKKVIPISITSTDNKLILLKEPQHKKRKLNYNNYECKHLDNINTSTNSSSSSSSSSSSCNQIYSTINTLLSPSSNISSNMTDTFSPSPSSSITSISITSISSINIEQEYINLYIKDDNNHLIEYDTDYDEQIDISQLISETETTNNPNTPIIAIRKEKESNSNPAPPPLLLSFNSIPLFNINNINNNI